MAQVDKSTSNDGGLSGSTQQLISLVDILQIVRKRIKYGILIALAVVIPFLVVFLSQEKTYQATATMMIELTPQNVMNIAEVVDTKVTHLNLLNTFMNTNIERIRTRALAEEVAAAMSEEDRNAFIEAYLGPLSERVDGEPLPSAASLILSRDVLEVERGDDDDSQVLKLTITHPIPRIAQTLANTYVEQFILYKALIRSDSNEDAVDFLKAQIDTMRVDLAESEMKLQDFRQENNLITLQQDQGIVVERLRRLSDALTEGRINLLEADGRVGQVQAANNDIDRLMEIPFIGDRQDINLIYGQLNELRRERLVLDQTYLRRHPKVIENEASIASVESVLNKSLSQAIQQVFSEREAIQGEVASLETKLKEAEEDVLKTERALIEYNQMERDVLKTREIFDVLMTRFNETSIARELDLNVVRMLDRAVYPTSPNTASLLQVSAAAFLLGGIFLIGVPLGLELLDNRLASFADIENFSGKPLLGDLRQFSKKSSKEISTAVLNRDADLIEPFRAIFSAIRLRSNISKEKISFVITSSLPDEGKSSIASNLASIVASHDYSVLLVDCDFRRPSIHLGFDLQNDHGLLRWYENGKPTVESSEVLANEDLGIVELGPNLFFLRSGGVTELPTEVFGDRKMESLFESLKENFDVVIMDTPPVGLFPDATLVGDNVDHCVFVARQFKVNRQKVRYSINLMDRSNASVLGVIFNGIKDVNAAVGYGNNSSNYYGHGFEKNASRYKEYYSQKR